jgi:hypothetical protein
MDNNLQELFINEAKDFFAKNNLDYEYRENIDGVCKFISPETKTILFYAEELDLSINIHFEKQIDFEIEHLNSFQAYADYNMNIFRCKLAMMLEFIETHRKLRSLKHQLKSKKLDTKWKSKLILNQLNAESEKEPS